MKPARERVTPGDLLQFFGPAGWWTQWYWPEGTRGKVWNFFHGYGWQVM
jgi:hypothetical protein